MGITGTFKGGATDPCYIYNKGTFGAVLPNGFTSQTSAPTNSGGVLTINGNTAIYPIISTSGINLTGYNYLKINVWVSNYYSRYCTVILKSSPSDQSNIFTSSVYVGDETWVLAIYSVASINQWVYLEIMIREERSNVVSSIPNNKISQIYLTTT